MARTHRHTHTVGHLPECTPRSQLPPAVPWPAPTCCLLHIPPLSADHIPSQSVYTLNVSVAHTHTHTHIQTYRHTQIHTQTDTQIHTHRHTNIHTHTHTHTHTQTHSHTD